MSSLVSELRLTEDHGTQVQRESILLRGPTFRLEPESISVLQSNEVNSQSNQGDVQRESDTLRGRPTDLIIGTETTGMRYGLDNLIHEGARMGDIINQMQDNTNEGLSIPWLEVENLQDVRRVELSDTTDNGCVSTYDINQSSEYRSVEKAEMEWKMEVGQKIFGGFEIVGPDNQGQQSKDVRFENTYILSNDGCGDNRMGRGIGENGGGNCSVNGTKINEKLLSEGDCNDRQHGQNGNEVEYQEMQSEKIDVVIGKKDPVSNEGHGRITTETTHSWNGEQSS
ncbi:MAG: hypothetical protein EZS28_036346 [Streblomastix strix]|uniref:Uncharacterized protein n=1 Tax=Streblomastix strix TaxID=222440 RepID=A0A5J4UC93_9EUKA|nr:MAG: hypothetical protein EZS28_036346 [Streblomastix strix]